VRIGKLTQINASRWPWQEIGQYIVFCPDKTHFGWRGFGSVGRFGGGWKFKLGIEVGAHSFDINCGIGIISIYREGGW
jgi:hypothetical protein